MRLIDADALLDEVFNRYCSDCDKRKGIKNGKYRIIYEIGEAPCRACAIDDMKAELEDCPTAEPQIIRCKDCKWFNDLGCAIRIIDDTDKPKENDFCSFAERREA